MLGWLFGRQNKPISHPLVGEWTVINMMTTSAGRMKIARNCTGTVSIRSDGTISESGEALLDSQPIKWTASGSYTIEGQSLVMRVEQHSMGGLAGKCFSRMFAFQPGTDEGMGRLDLPLGDQVFALGIKRIGWEGVARTFS